MLWTHAKEGLLGGASIYVMLFRGDGWVLRNDSFPETWEPYDSFTFGQGLYAWPMMSLGASKVYQAPIPIERSGTFVYIAYRKASIFGLFDEANDQPIVPFGQLQWAGTQVNYSLAQSFGQVSAYELAPGNVGGERIEFNEQTNAELNLQQVLRLLLAVAIGETTREDAGNGRTILRFYDPWHRMTRVSLEVDSLADRKETSFNSG